MKVFDVAPPPDTVVAPIRNSVRALILQQNRVLLLRKRGPGGGERYAMPGGGQDAGERLHHALIRECMEELGTRVDILGLLHVAEAFKPTGGKQPGYRQQVEFIFQCRVPIGYVPHNGSKPDKHQQGVEWLGLQHLEQVDLRPEGMAALIRRAALCSEPVYLGDI